VGQTYGPNKVQKETNPNTKQNFIMLPQAGNKFFHSHLGLKLSERNWSERLCEDVGNLQ